MCYYIGPKPIILPSVKYFLPTEKQVHYILLRQVGKKKTCSTFFFSAENTKRPELTLPKKTKTENIGCSRQSFN